MPTVLGLMHGGAARFRAALHMYNIMPPVPGVDKKNTKQIMLILLCTSSSRQQQISGVLLLCVLLPLTSNTKTAG